MEMCYALKSFLTVLFLCAAAWCLNAQIGLGLEVSQKNYLKYEPVYVRVTMKNFTAHPIVFGEAEKLRGTLGFEIKRMNDRNSDYIPLISKSVEPKVDSTIIASGGIATFTFDISRYYYVPNTGAYSVRAVVRHPQLPNEYLSASRYFTVVPGIKLWSTEVGVPDYIIEGGKATPSKVLDSKKDDELLKTRSVSAYSYFTGMDTVYTVEVRDRENIYLQRRLGFDIGGNLRPQFMIDFLSRVNVIVAASPKVFIYYQFSLNGDLEKTQVLMKTGSSPTLVSDSNTGFVSIAGGREAKIDIDYEEIKSVPLAARLLKVDIDDDDLADLDAIPSN